MRVITWNCNQNFRSKFDLISALSPNLLIVQECEYLPQNHFPNAEYLWVGQNNKKGLGVLIFKDAGSISPEYDEKYVEFLPINTDFGQLLGVWAFNHRAKKYGDDVKGHILQAIQKYRSFLTDKNTMGVVGDFNSLYPPAPPPRRCPPPQSSRRWRTRGYAGTLVPAGECRTACRPPPSPR